MPEPVGYTATVFWREAIFDGSDVTVEHRNTLAEAERAGMHLGCLFGVRRVEVRSADGTLHALWNKESRVTFKRRRGWVENGRGVYDVEHLSSTWQRISGESRAEVGLMLETLQGTT